MRYAVLVMLDTEMPPETIIEEIRSNLEFDLFSTNTTIKYAIVLTDDGEEVAAYDRQPDASPKLF